MATLKDYIGRAQDACGRAVFYLQVHGPDMARMVRLGINMQRLAEGIGNPTEWLRRHAPDLLEDFAEGRIRIETGPDGRPRIIHDCRPERTPRRRHS